MQYHGDTMQLVSPTSDEVSLQLRGRTPMDYCDNSIQLNEPMGDEDPAAQIIALLWRRRIFIGALCFFGMVVAGLVTTFMANRYTSEAVLQPSFERRDPQLQSEVSFDAASVIQTQVNLIRSREIVEGVVARLGLAEDLHFAADSSRARALALIGLWKPVPNSRDTAARRVLRKFCSN